MSYNSKCFNRLFNIYSNPVDLSGPMINIHTAKEQANSWLIRHRAKMPHLSCVLGFTATALIPGISAAGATAEDRQYTAVADAEFLFKGSSPNPIYPLPPLSAGVSPVFISRAVIEELSIPFTIFNAGLPTPPPIPHIDLQGISANCLTSGQALPLEVVEHLYQAGLSWGSKLAALNLESYLILGECVVGGTTTALAVLLGLGIEAAGLVNSSHRQCNHQQKIQIVHQGLSRAQLKALSALELIAAVGDPMQIVVAGMAIAASSQVGVMLAGGTQMLAVYALIQNLNNPLTKLENIVVGTTRWVAQDSTADTVKLASLIDDNLVLLSTNLSFADSIYPSLRIYEQGYVKEGVAAGGVAIASNLIANWQQPTLLNCIESLVKRSLLEKNE